MGISSTVTAHPGDAVPHTPPYNGTGRPPVAKYPDAARRVKQPSVGARRSPARLAQWREGSRPGSGRSDLKRMYGQLVALRVRPAGREIRKTVAGPELPACRLLAEWPATEPEPVRFWCGTRPSSIVALIEKYVVFACHLR